jgi:hypothetical protein
MWPILVIALVLLIGGGCGLAMDRLCRHRMRMHR